jgi:hypothetical protein
VANRVAFSIERWVGLGLSFYNASSLNINYNGMGKTLLGNNSKLI